MPLSSLPRGGSVSLLFEPSLLPIPPRRQWDHAHGFCGETAVQSIALYYGVWLSQACVRDVAGGEVLLGVNAAAALTRLHFTFSEWDSALPGPQFGQLTPWLQQHLTTGSPVLFGVYLADGDDPDYDHIVTAVGTLSTRSTRSARSTTGNGMRPEPTATESVLRRSAPLAALMFYDHFSPALVTVPVADLSASRADCRSGGASGLRIPHNVAYAIAVHGLVDEGGASAPVRLLAGSWDEADPMPGKPGPRLCATVIVSSLTAGKRYALLRYDDYRQLPTAGDPADQLAASGYVQRVDFVPDASSWSYLDQDPLPSGGVAYFRCLPVPTT